MKLRSEGGRGRERERQTREKEKGSKREIRERNNFRGVLFHCE
jgi:hypothetical protein